MKSTTSLEELLRTCSDLNLWVRVEPVDPVSTSRGGLCRLRGRTMVVLDSRASEGERAAVLAEALANYTVDASTYSRQTQVLIGIMRRRLRRLKRANERRQRTAASATPAILTARANATRITPWPGMPCGPGARGE